MSSQTWRSLLTCRSIPEFNGAICMAETRKKKICFGILYLFSFFFAFDLLLKAASQWIISHWPGNDELRVTLSALTPVPSADGPFLWIRQRAYLKLLAVMASCLLAHVRHACKPSTWIGAHGSSPAIYLLTVTLPLLPTANRVKCRDEFSRAVGKILTAGHWWLVDGQGIWVLKDWIPVSRSIKDSTVKND